MILLDAMMSQYRPVLLAEDDENDLVLMRRAFEMAGILHPLMAVPDGAEALSYLRGEGPYAERTRYPLPCLLLLDLKMPRVDGLEVLEWVAQQPQLRETMPVVVHSGSGLPDEVQKALKLGAREFRLRPQNFSSLLSQMLELKGRYLVDGHL